MVLTRPSRLLARHPPLYHGQSLLPAGTSHRTGAASRGINEGSSNSPVRSSPRLWPPGWNGPPLGFPPSFAPRRPGADDARRGGDRPSSTGLNYTLNITSVDPPIRVVHSQRATSRRTTTNSSAGVLLLDASRSGAGPDRRPADSSVSSGAMAHPTRDDTTAFGRRSRTVCQGADRLGDLASRWVQFLAAVSHGGEEGVEAPLGSPRSEAR
jgi:hypothetical protein